MKQTISKDAFRFLFNQVRPDNFTYEGQGVLFDYLEQLEEDLGQDLEFDPIAFCCDFTECSIKEFTQAYSFTDMEVYFDSRDEEVRAEISKYIDHHGSWYQFLNDGKDLIFQNF